MRAIKLHNLNRAGECIVKIFLKIYPSKVTCITAHALESRGVLKTPHCIPSKESDDFRIKNIFIQIPVIFAHLYISNRHRVCDFQMKGYGSFKRRDLGKIMK